MSLSFAGTGLFHPAPLKIASGILAGLLTARMFVIYHDFQHGAILRKSVVARAVMTLFGILTLAPASIWTETHEHHHHHNSQFSRFILGSFPTLTTHMFKGMNKGQQIKYLVIRHPLMIVFAYIPIFLVSFCLWPFAENPRKYADCGLAVAVHAGIALGLYATGGWFMLLYSLLLPCLVMYALGGYIFYAQHNFTSVNLTHDENWDYLDAALNSSSYIKMNRLMRWFTANIGYHHVHHVNSRIPFYRLPEVMRAIPELQHPRTTSLQPAEILKCLQLKLWDEEKSRMITLKELQSI